mgnify:CR=1 FL=1|jgi:capsular exopolysaccharide synthesis family protein
MKGYQHNPMVKPNGKREGLGLRATRNDGQEAGEAQVDFSEIWGTIREGKWIILLTAILVTGAIAAYTLTLEPVYRASSIVSIESQAASQNLAAYGGGTPDLADEIGLLQYSAELATRVAVRMKETAETVESTDYFPVLLDKQGNPLPDQKAGQAIMEKTSFNALSQEQMIRIAVRSEVPEEASAVANAYAEEYQQFSRERSRASVSAARNFLEQQAEKRKQEIRELERQWASFARQNNVMTQGEDGSRLIQEYTGLESRRSELQFQLEQEEQSLEILKNQLAQYQPELRSQVRQEQEASELQSAISAINEQIAQLRTQATQYYVANPELEGDTSRIQSDFPELADINRRIRGFEDQKDQLLNQLITKASESATTGEGGALSRIQQLQNRITEQEITVSQLNAQINALDNRLATYDDRLQNIPEQRLERNRLEQKLAQAEQFYGSIVNQLQQVIMRQESELGYVRPVRSAVVPSVPVSPNVEQNLVLGLLLGIGFGVGLAFLRRAVADQLRAPEDLQAKGYSLVGVIPKMDREVKAAFNGEDTVKVGERQLSTRLMPLLNPWSPISENYRLIRTNLQHSAQGAPQVILVTSPEKGDGKTLTAVNLAITMAQSGKRTILVDADLRRPNAHRMLDADLEPGVAEILNGTADSDLRDHVRSTEVERLHLLPAGRTEVPPAEALDSDRMKNLIDRFRDEYDIVIVDSPPVLAVSDPVLLSTHADATLLVVSADRTDLRAVEVTEKTLNAVDVPISGVIFNQFDESKRRGYGYGYDYKKTYEYALDE